MTKPNADESMKLMDAGYRVLLFKNDLGSYTAIAIKPSQDFDEASENDRQITDEFTPSKALHRLTEKLVFGRIVGEWEKP